MHDTASPTWVLGPVRDPIDRDVSLRIDVLRIILIGLIVLCHGGLGLLSPDSPPMGPLTNLLIEGLNLRVDSVAVPLFFTISGFLFLRKAELSLPAYKGVLWHKCFAMLVPYLVFNLVILAYFFFVGSIFLIGSWGFVLRHGFFAKLLGLGTMPINTPLWFLRDLIVIFALSPIMLFFFKKAPQIGLCLLTLGWLAASSNPYSFWGEGFFFYLGGYVARTRFPLGGVSWWQRLAFWLVIAATPVLVHVMPLGIGDRRLWGCPNKLYMFFGVIFFWRLAAFRWIRDSRALHRSAQHSFFIYLAHEPVISLLQAKLLSVWQPVGDAQQITCYFTLGLGTIVLLWAVAEGLSRLMPRTYAVLTGAWFKVRRAPSPSQVSGK